MVFRIEDDCKIGLLYMNTYKKGRRGEKRVAERQRKRGNRYIRLSPGSRGPYDVSWTTPRGNRAYAQVKSGTARMSRKEKRKLIRYAKKKKGIALYVRENRGKVKAKTLGNFAKKRRRRR
jgi:hypothetical protein